MHLEIVRCMLLLVVGLGRGEWKRRPRLSQHLRLHGRPCLALLLQNLSNLTWAMVYV